MVDRVHGLALLSCCLAASAAEAGFAPLGGVLFLDEEAFVEAVSLRRQAISAAPQAVSVIDVGGSTIQPPWTVPDRLRYESGIDVYQRRHAQFDIGLRGLNGHNAPRTLVVREGREFAIEELSQVPWISHLHLSDIARVEVVKGPGSVTYGANAFGGVISLAGRPVGDVHELHTYGDAGDDGLLDVDVTGLGPMRLPGAMRGWYKVSVGAAQRDDFAGVRGVPPVDHAQADHTGSVDLRSLRARGEIGVSWPTGVSVTADLAWVDIDQWDFLEDFSPGSNRLTMTDLDVGVRLRFPYGELRWNRRSYQTDYANQRSLFDPIADAFSLFRYTRIGLDGGNDRLRLQFGGQFKGHQFAAGAEWLAWSGKSNIWEHGSRYEDRGTWGQARYHNHAVFLEDQWEPDDRWVVSAGVRYDRHSEVGDNWSPRLAVNYRYQEGGFFRLGYSSGYRLPTPFELFIDEWFFRAADDIDMESVQSWDIGWTHRCADPDIQIQLGGFFSSIHDPLLLLPLSAAEMEDNWLRWLATGPDPTQPPGPFFEYRNHASRIDVAGLEASVRCRFADRRGQVWANATWQELRWQQPLRYQSAGFSDPVSGGTLFAFDYPVGHRDAPPRFKMSAGASWDWGDWFLSGALRWVDQQDFFAFSATYFDSGGDLGMDTRPAYWAADLALGYRWDCPSGRRRFVRLSVLDAFDNGHYAAHRVDPQTLIDDGEWQWASRIGRQIAVVAAWEF